MVNSRDQIDVGMHDNLNVHYKIMSPRTPPCNLNSTLVPSRVIGEGLEATYFKLSSAKQKLNAENKERDK